MAFKIKKTQVLQKKRERDTEEREHCAGVRLASRNVTVGRSSDVDLNLPHLQISGECIRTLQPNFSADRCRSGGATEFFDNLA